MSLSASQIKTPSFVHEMPLRVTSGQGKALLTRMDMARQLYNACLGESLKRLSLVRKSEQYREARTMPYTDKKARTAAFKALNKKYGFLEYDLHSFAVNNKNSCHIGDHLDVHTVQKIASRAFGAVQMHALGKRGRPRFKGRDQIVSVESKSNLAGIRFRTDNCCSRIEWSGLVLPCLLDKKDKHGVQAHALYCRTKYVRLVCRKVRGKNLFFAQLVQEGYPKKKTKNRISCENVSMDIGPSTYGLYTPGYAELDVFCGDLDRVHSNIRVLQRTLDRKRRANNPDNYNPNGTIKKGKKIWTASKRYLKTKAELAGLHEKQAETRKSLHGQLSNRILSLGSTVKMERLSYKSFQRNFGKSVGFRAPGMFVSMLRRKAESAGGKVIELPTQKLKLSQTCHCGHVEKKPLSRRWHSCPECGAIAQRDLYSAFLAYHVQNDVLDTAMAKASWPSAEPLLEQVVSGLRHQSAIEGVAFPRSFGLELSVMSKSGSPVKESYAETDSQHAMFALCRHTILEKGLDETFGTPGL